MHAPSLRWRLFLLKYDRLSSGVGSRMENDTASASGTRGASKLKAWRVSQAVTAFGWLALLFAGQWYDGHNRIGALRDELAQRVRESESDSRDARLAARQAQEAAREVQAKLAQIELKFAEFQNQQIGLEALYEELSRNRDEWVIAEIEQILVIASQQLQLTGNVQVALSALQTAEARLARSALLARDETAYRSDVKLAAGWLERYFDTRSRAAAATAATLKQLASDSIRASLPTIGESLAAVRAYKPVRKQAGQ